MYTQIRKLETRKVTAKTMSQTILFFSFKPKNAAPNNRKFLFAFTCHGCNCISNMQSLYSTTHTHT